MNHPALTIGVIAYNEEAYLPYLLADLSAQTYSHEKTEIILVDGGSTDRTKSIMESFSNQHSDFFAIRVLDNPKKIQPAGWNVVLKHARGDVISRIDAHTSLPPDFAQKVMKHIEAGENVVGGVRPCLIENKTKWGEILLRTENSLFGSSANISRRSEKEQYVKTMFHASYRKKVFDKVGLFNEALLRTEDNEMHYRIRKAGYRLLYDPQIVSYQYARSDFKKMLRQKFLNGLWIGRTLSVCPRCISAYHLVPFLFVGAILVTTVLSCFGIWQFSSIMWGLYAAFAIANMILSALNESFNGYMFLMPLIYLLLHLSYGIGTTAGICSIPFWKKKLKQ